ncbi:MAG TPA: universal stress protein [Gammaproteobacteria bacterium]|nr:universal stress protein [Gammaproteobacteria bacterium]
MTYKTLLVAVTNSRHRRAVLDSAAMLAEAFDAHVTGIDVFSPRYPSPAAVAAEYPGWNNISQMREEMEAAEKQAEQRKQEFTSMMDSEGLRRSEWRFVVGDPLETLALHARYADLVITGQVDPDDPAGGTNPDLPARVAMASARPVLVIPYAGTFPTVGRHALVAWNATREATRAVQEALPLLQRAESVRVAVFQNGRDFATAHGEEPGADIALYLSRHGIKVETSRLPAGDIAVGDALLSLMADTGTDLLCMGAYGHSRLREIALGGVTHDILRHMTAPVLMAH